MNLRISGKECNVCNSEVISTSHISCGFYEISDPAHYFLEFFIAHLFVRNSCTKQNWILQIKKNINTYLLYYVSISFLVFVSLISFSKWCKNYHKINKGFVKCSHIKIKSSIHSGTYCRILWVNFVIFVIFVTQISCNWSALIDNKP